MRRFAFYGGSFDPPHLGHLAVARALLMQFRLDHFTFIPAFHAPHKLRKTPTSAYDRYAMLCLATQNDPKTSVSKMELEMPERPFSVETLTRLIEEFPDDRIYFVMGADSWMEIAAWREWERVLSLTDHIVVTRPGIEIDVSHVTDDISKRIVDLRGNSNGAMVQKRSIFITNAVNLDISATEIRRRIRENESTWRAEVPPEVANYIEKYQIYS